jgi:hypothetical protein
MRMGCWKTLRRVVPAGANRRAVEEGSSDDAHLLAHCACEVVRCAGVCFVGNALDSTDMGEVMAMRGCMDENRAPFPEPCQALAAKAAVPRIVMRGRRTSLPESDGELAHYGKVRPRCGDERIPEIEARTT